MCQNLKVSPFQKTRRQLEEENLKLQNIADHDWLTGLYNRGAMERIVNEYLHKGSPGTLIMMDLDHFKQVNDRYGHIIGDELLHMVGTILEKMIGRHKLVGRVGGDEFVIFSPQAMSEAETKEVCIQIRERFREIRLRNSILLKLSITLAVADSQAGWQYKDLFDCADQIVLEMKKNRNFSISSLSTDNSSSSLNLDLKQIASEMEETDVLPGAYCQDFDTFKQIYRLSERLLTRDKREVYIILFTLTDQNNEFLTLDIRDHEMALLGEQLKNSLRIGDVYTQYSSGQYLVMVSGASGKDTEMIALRVSQAYYDCHEKLESQTVLHHSYPLSPVKVLKENSSGSD